MKILNFGSLNLDYTYQVPHFVRPGETLSPIKMQTFPGGKGLNQSIAIARAGLHVYHAGAVGRHDGELLQKTLQKDHVDTSLIRLTDEPSGHAIIQVDPSGENCILLYGGANQTMDKQYIHHVFSGFSSGDILVLQNEINEREEIISVALNKSMRIMFNPAPMDDGIKNLPLRSMDMLIVNETEAAQLCSVPVDQISPQIIQESYPGMKFVLTLGKKGAYCFDGMHILRQGIFGVDVVDTTGAGDTFTGYFIAGLAQELPLKENLYQASKAASIAVSRAGASTSIPYLSEVKQSAIKEI
ncbi:MAG: ribokinase [Christensenellales bacterium]